GAGRMGCIRAISAQMHPQCEVVNVVDSLGPQADSLATQLGCSAGTDWTKLVESKDIDVVVVATPHKYLAPISIAALKAGKHVFCEKPGARSAAEIQMALSPLDTSEIAKQIKNGEAEEHLRNLKLIVGFTLRHHPAIARARELITQGVIGRPMYILG